MEIVDSKVLEDALLKRFHAIPEIGASGFTARSGLTGTGVTLMHGRSYFGSWRGMLGTLVWSYSNASEANYFAPSVDEAARYTMLLILRRLETSRQLKAG